MRLGRALLTTSLLSLALVSVGVSVGVAAQFLLPPESTSGSFSMERTGAPVSGGGHVSTPDGDAISFGFAAPFGSLTSTGASASWFQIDSVGMTIMHAGQLFDVTCPTHPSSCTSLGADSPFGNGPSRFSMHADPPRSMAIQS